MVEATNPNNKLDVKISLDLSSRGMSPIVKRVLASDFNTLTAQAVTLAGKHGVPASDVRLRYYDGDAWVIVEDNDDLDLAFAIAMSDGKKISFSIKPTSAPVASSVEPKMEDEEMKEEQPDKSHKKGGKGKGMPRKALKNLINNELEKQAKEVFHQLLKSDDLPVVQQASENTDVVHEGITCDGCGEGPIQGLRFKCSVCKNFDYCSKCEERLGHEHAFLKIRQAGGAPDVMITMLGEEENPYAQPEEAKNPMNFLNEMMMAFNNAGHQGRGGRGGRGRGGRGGHGGGPFRGMLKEFMNKMGDCKDWKAEDFQKKMQDCGKDWNFNGKPQWKQARAVCLKKPEEILEIVPGTTQIVEIEVLNDTHWPWKHGCTLTLSGEQEGIEMPIEAFSIPVEQEIKGKSSGTFQLPLTMASHMVADEEKVYTVNFTFCGPKGCPFGAAIPLKMKCVLPKRVSTDIEIYKLAIKLHEQLQLGSLDDCIKTVRDNNCDEAECVKALQRND